MDLRGYGDSGRPEAGEGSIAYSKREMALDALAAMEACGFTKFGVLAHDRGAVDVGHLGLPCWVKPARLGSSVGIVKVKEDAELEAALDVAFAHDSRVIVEASAPDGALEVECSVLGPTEAPEVSVAGEIVIASEWYDYEAKYTPGGMELVVPARISASAAARVKALAAHAFTAAGCCGLARADFFVSGEDVLLNELNTMPGQTPTSVYGKLWAASGLAYPDLLTRLCEVGIARHRAERDVRH
jgi:D-alanine-D-alanine ligase